MGKGARLVSLGSKTVSSSILVTTLACSPLTAVTLMDIQGRGQFSPFQGRVVETSGVVTYIAPYGEGFFLQDPSGDDDPSTSDGIFVAVESQNGNRLPSVGDTIRISARVEELQAGAALPRTQLTRVDWVEVISSGGSLPASVELEDLPHESLAEGIRFWESLEGMRVLVRDGLVVSPTSRYGEFALLTKANARPGSGFYPETEQIFLRPLGENDVDYNPERILAARGRGEKAALRPGDRVVELMGVVDYTFGNYKVIPSRLELETRGPPELPVSTRSGRAGDTVITTFNVENLFDLEDDPEKDDEGNTPSPEELETKLRKLAMAIRIELDLPDILVVQEVENIAILARLADRINRESRTSYVAASRGSSDPRGIENGFLWDSNRVKLREAFLLPGPEVESTFGREPLVGVFEIHGRELIIIGNHFKSKAGDDPLYGVNDPPIRSTEIRRKAQARVVRNYVNSILKDDADAWVMVAGDLNDFPFREPGEGTGHPLAILEGRSDEVPLANLVLRIDPAEAYTYIYQGNSQIVDYILVSPSLLDAYASVGILHFNAAQPADSSRDPTIPLRSSDHDPVEARFKLRKD